jgi:hypothetical protein
MTTKQGRDNYLNCPICRKGVWISQVTLVYSAAERCWWFLTGQCKECQKNG